MATTVAKNKKDVDQMDKRERLYDSLSYTYGKKGEKLSQEYDKAYSQADRQALSRGMQRSSYNNQTLANINKQRIDALDDNESAMIADYENRLQDIEAQELAADQWERQFAEGQRQYDTSLAFQQAEADRAQANTDRNYNFQLQQYGDSRKDADWNKAFQEKQYGDSRADAAWNQNFQTQQYADTRKDADWNKAFQEKQYNDNRGDTAWNQAFQTQQAAVAQDQWEREFARAGQSTGQQIAMSYISQIASAGGDPSDELLKQAGISRADYNAMKAQIVASTGGGYGGNGGNTNKTSDNPFDALKNLAGLTGNGNGGLTDASFNNDIYGLGANGERTLRDYASELTAIAKDNKKKTK